MPTNVLLTDKLKVPTQRTITDSGQLIVPCAFARTGIQEYTAAQLGITDVAANTIIKVTRKEDQVFDEASMSTFRSCPVTLGHPPENVTSVNAYAYQKGFLEGMPVRDEDCLTGTIVITDKATIEAVEEGIKELSAGYLCDISYEEKDGERTYYQSNIRANHIAIVAKGRAGGNCRIADEKTLELKDAEIADLKAQLVAAKDADLEGQIKTLKDEAKAFNDTQAELIATVVKATELTDIDLCFNTTSELKRAVVEDAGSIEDLKSKNDAYVAVVFDLLYDSRDVETPMGILLRDNAKVPEPKVSKVKTSRDNMIKRNSHKSED